MKKDRLRLIIARARRLLELEYQPYGPEDLSSLSTVRPRGW